MDEKKRQKRKNGEGSWGKRTIHGINYVYLKKTYPFLTSPKIFYGKTEAEVKQKQREFESEEIHIDKRNVPKESFYQYMLSWLYNEKKQDIKDTTFDGYEQYIEHYIKDYDLGRYQMVNINDKKIFQDHMKELAEKFSRNTIERTYAVIKQCLDYAVENNHIKVNYARQIKIISEDKVASKKKEINFLEEDDMDKLYNECHRLADKDCQVNGKRSGEKIYGKNAYIVVLIMYTGMRISECCALKWKDIDDKFINISKNKVIVKDRTNETGNNYKQIINTPKTKSSKRTIPLCDRSKEMLGLLREYSDCKPNSFVIGEQNRRNITRTLDAMLKRADCKVESCGVHALRHSFATELFNQGMDIKTVSDIMGHSDIKITSEIYVHVINKKKLEAIHIFNKADVLHESNILQMLEEHKIFISEIENGSLGYVKDNKINKLSFVDTIDVSGTTVKASDIYNIFYKNKDN